MTLNYRNFSRIFFVFALLLIGILPAAHAEDDDDDEHAAVVSNAKWQTECGACHVAFPPRLLPAESWRAMMAGLDKHFGTDASLDVLDAAEISAFLEKNAGRKGRAGKPLLRITATAWFKREHDEVAASVWKNPKVKTPANCAACHIQAESGNYSERNIRMPK